MFVKTFSIILCFSLSVSGNRVQLPDDKLRDEDVLHGILKRLTSLESKYHHQADENVHLRSSVTDLQAKISTLQEENQQLHNQMREMKSRDQARNLAMKDLQRQMSVIVARDQERDKEMKDLCDYIRKPERQDNRVSPDEQNGGNKMISQNSISDSVARGIRSIQRRENEMNVAFFSTLGNHLQHLGVNQNIVFDHVITNVGNAYNNHAGDFRAPVAGTYVFSVTLMAYVSHTTHYNVVRNGSSVASLYVRGKESPYASSSMTAVLELKQGEDVAIRNVDLDEYLHGSSYSTFSGFLLTQDFSNPIVVGK